MSRLDAVAEALGVSTDEARQFTRAVRAQFEAAPSYAQILRAIKGAGTRRPTPQQVAAHIKSQLLPDERRGPRAARRPSSRPQRRRRDQKMGR